MEIVSDTYKKQEEWDIAIGLQLVDNLNPSKYFKKIIKDHINGIKTLIEIEDSLKDYYTDQKEINNEEYECDLVSTRIVKLLEEDEFELSINHLKYIHKYLFEDIYDFAGKFRKYNFSKREIVLKGDSALYGDYKNLEECLKYDLNIEKNKNYKEMSIDEIIKSIVEFTSNIWQAHPFEEGNTRTTAIFIQEYLKKMNFKIDNSLFKDKSIYYRNALVRSNYHNDGVKENDKYLTMFYENLLLNKNNKLNSKDMII